MKNSFSLTIALPAQHLMTFEAKQVRIPASDGYLGIMANRKPLVASLGPGLIHIVNISDEHFWFGTTGGFCEMLNNHAILLCDSLIQPEDAEKVSYDPEKALIRTNPELMSEKKKIEFVAKLLTEKLYKLDQQQKKLQTEKND